MKIDGGIYMYITIKRLSEKPVLILAFVFSSVLIVAFQNCGKSGSDIVNNFQSTLSQQRGTCTATLDFRDPSVCIEITGCDLPFCSTLGSSLQIQAQGNSPSDLQCNNALANLSLHGCTFGTNNADTRISNFAVDETLNTINLAVNEATIEVIENDDVDDEENPKEENVDEDTEIDVRLVSFYSLVCGSERKNSIDENGGLYKVNIDNSGNVILSDSSQVFGCGTFDGTTLACSYNVNSGCVFQLTLWSYDSQNRFSPGHTIRIAGK